MKKTISLLFAGILAALLLSVCLLPQRTFSDMENRSLQQFPAPTLNGVRSREWMDQMESWLADQFPGAAPSSSARRRVWIICWASAISTMPILAETDDSSRYSTHSRTKRS